MDKNIYKIIGIDIEKIWGSKKEKNKMIGEVIKFEVNEQQSNDIIDNLGNTYNLYQLYSSVRRKIIFGKKYIRCKQFPFLIKYIYSAKKLSLQVHPREKKETWLFLKNDSKVLIGLNKSIKNNEINLNNILNNSNIETVKKYNFIIVNPGTIHSILENNIVCEIQNNYDATYRYYDWDNHRELTQKEFVENADFKKMNKQKNIIECLRKYTSSKFKIKKIDINGDKKFKNYSNCKVLIVLEGKGLINIDKEKIEINSDEAYFILPNSKFIITGVLDILLIS